MSKQTLADKVFAQHGKCPCLYGGQFLDFDLVEGDELMTDDMAHRANVGFVEIDELPTGMSLANHYEVTRPMTDQELGDYLEWKTTRESNGLSTDIDQFEMYLDASYDEYWWDYEDYSTWAEDAYRHRYPELWGDLPDAEDQGFALSLVEDEPDKEADAEGELYEHLPAFESRVYAMSVGAGWYWDRYEVRENRRSHNGRRVHTTDGVSEWPKGWYSSDSHGRHGRFKATKEEIRRARAYTYRQMDTIWMQEMTEVDSSTSWYLLEEILRDFLHQDEDVLENPEHLPYYEQRLVAVADISRELRLEWAARSDCEFPYHELDLLWMEDEDRRRDYDCGLYLRGPWDKDGTYYDPFEVGNDYLLEDPSWDYRWEDYDDYVDDPWGAEHYELAYSDELDKGEAFVDRYEHGVLTEADIEALDTEAAAAEAKADELEARFEHLPISNAIGERARKAHAAAAA